MEGGAQKDQIGHDVSQASMFAVEHSPFFFSRSAVGQPDTVLTFFSLLETGALF